MLVLTRAKDQVIELYVPGQDVIRLVVVEGRAKIGIEADRRIVVMRDEAKKKEPPPCRL